MSNERGLSPLQLWTRGILRNTKDRFNPLDTLLTRNEQDSYEGDGGDGNECPEGADDESVVVPQSNVVLRNQQRIQLNLLVSNLSMNRHNNIQKYVAVMKAVQEMSNK